ncbi:sensor histidine kinase [Leptothermofonsia sp. ETS-13]|uniref:sensor histidine kinase n=1 Tax=Leptothermofonsia sp. ETS-13 TaxID=3035696 RepID=UPI003B9DECFF
MSSPSDRPISLSSTLISSLPASLRRQVRAYWHTFWGETRTRILTWYVLILIFTFGLSIPIFRYLLFAKIDARVRQDMAEEMEDFRRLLANSSDFVDDDNVHQGGSEARRSKNSGILSAIHWDGRQKPSIKSPSTGAELKQFFNAYMAHRVPEDEVYLIAFVDGQFYRSSPSGRPTELGTNSSLMQRWAQQTWADQGEISSADPDIGNILYLVQPVEHQNQLLGVFVIVHTTAGEWAEGLEATWIAAQVAGGALILALLLAWLASGRVLQPLQTLATTVEAINESDLTRRISVQGKDELARLAAQFNEMMNRVETAFITQREFVNDAGHELRTPITIIRGNLEVMEVLSTEQRETLALVTDELDRMSRIVDDLIVLAKSERPDFLQLETVELAPFMQDLFAKVKTLAPRNWYLEEVAQGQIRADRQRLTQAIMNLVQNATQHTQPTDSITLGSAIAKGKVHFWVCDTGTGIPPADQKRIFERFARLTHQRRRSEGAGLGLAIVKAIATAHGGTVTLRSQLGEGATFAIVLPLKRQ